MYSMCINLENISGQTNVGECTSQSRYELLFLVNYEMVNEREVFINNFIASCNRLTHLFYERLNTFAYLISSALWIRV